MGHSSLVRALCAASADVSAAKSNGATPLHVAADSDQPRAVAALLAQPCGAAADALVNGDATPL
eukprot:1407310-Pleurochrysis_carterae.AAC.2